MMKNLKISTKIGGGFAITIAILMVLAAQSLYAMVSVDKSFNETVRIVNLFDEIEDLSSTFAEYQIKKVLLCQNVLGHLLMI